MDDKGSRSATIFPKATTATETTHTMTMTIKKFSVFYPQVLVLNNSIAVGWESVQSELSNDRFLCVSRKKMSAEKKNP